MKYTDQTVAEIQARLVEVRAQIAKARKAQTYMSGAGMSVTRGLLKTLLDEENDLLEALEYKEASTASTAGADFTNKVSFERPR